MMDEESVGRKPLLQPLPYECSWCGIRLSNNREDSVEHVKTCVYRPGNILLAALKWYTDADMGELTRDGGRRAKAALKKYEKVLNEGYRQK